MIHPNLQQHLQQQVNAHNYGNDQQREPEATTKAKGQAKAKALALADIHVPMRSVEFRRAHQANEDGTSRRWTIKPAEENG